MKRFKLDNGEVKGILDGANLIDEQWMDIVVDAGISIDGSWNSCGWSVHDGMVSVISIDTGKVLDVIPCQTLKTSF